MSISGANTTPWAFRSFQQPMKVLLYRCKEQENGKCLKLLLLQGFHIFSTSTSLPLYVSPLIPEILTDILPSHLPMIPSFFPTSLGHILLNPHSSAEMTRGKEKEIKELGYWEKERGGLKGQCCKGGGERKGRETGKMCLLFAYE